MEEDEEEGVENEDKVEEDVGLRDEMSLRRRRRRRLRTLSRR